VLNWWVESEMNFDLHGPLSYTDRVHRALALLLIPALIGTSGVMSLLHTHAYDDHDHPEHHHGLSAHEHSTAPSHPDDGTAHLEGCDPAQHVVSFVFVCAAPPQLHAVDAELTLPATPDVKTQIERGVRHTDVRVHGPPPRTQSSPRAPPLTHLA
jgi:hypothetical protein